jgi:hypothetical protein
MTAAIAVDRGEMRIIKSQAGHILKGWPIIESRSIESGVCVVAAAKSAARGSCPRGRSANSGAALRSCANVDVRRSGTCSRHHHAGAASRYRCGSVRGTAMLRRGERWKRQYHHHCY